MARSESSLRANTRRSSDQAFAEAAWKTKPCSSVISNHPQTQALLNIETDYLVGVINHVPMSHFSFLGICRTNGELFESAQPGFNIAQPLFQCGQAWPGYSLLWPEI